MSDEGRRNPSLVLVLLIEPEGSISHVSPAHVIAPVAFRVPRLQVFSPGALEGTGSIVRAEEEQSVLPFSFFFEVRNEPADVLVHDVDHGSKHFHPPCFPVFFIIRQRFPGGNVSGAGTELVVPWEQLRFKLFLIALFAKFIPARIVDTLVFRYLLLGGLKRVMRGVICDVEKKWRRTGFLVGWNHLIDKVDCEVGDGGGGIERFPVQICGNVPGFAAQSEGVVSGEKVCRPRKVSPIVIESEVNRVAREVPLA